MICTYYRAATCVGSDDVNGTDFDVKTSSDDEEDEDDVDKEEEDGC